jgi:hypothetical protein
VRETSCDPVEGAVPLPAVRDHRLSSRARLAHTRARRRIAGRTERRVRNQRVFARVPRSEQPAQSADQGAPQGSRLEWCPSTQIAAHRTRAAKLPVARSEVKVLHKKAAEAHGDQPNALVDQRDLMKEARSTRPGRPQRSTSPEDSSPSKRDRDLASRDEPIAEESWRPTMCST